MPQSPTPTEPELPEQPSVEPSRPTQNPDAPVSFVPHDGPGAAPQAPFRIRTGRHGEMEAHELIRLLDSIEDERARSRFRESIYISFFFWLAVAWLIFYGPRVLWHAPQLINPADAIRKQELTELNAPVLMHPAPRVAPKPVRPTIDKNTIKRLQAMTREQPAPAPAPAPTAPANPQPTPPSVVPTPAPTPRVPNAPIPEAPSPHTQTKPNFSTPGTSLNDTIRESARNRDNGGGGSGLAFTSKGAAVGGGVQVLSDTQGVDFSDYLRRLKSDVYRNWIPLLPEEVEPPIRKEGETYIVFTILPDGKIGEMHLEASTKDVALDKAAWGSIISEGQFPPLPSQFHGPNLMLRFHYIVNKGIGQ